MTNLPNSGGPPDRARRRGPVPPELLILGGAVSVQGGGGIAARLLQSNGVLPVVAMRVAFSAALLLLLRRPRQGAVSRRAWQYAIALGIVMAVMNSLFYFSISRIPLGVAVTIEFWGPLAVAVAGSRRLIDFGWAVLAAAGIYLLTGGRFTADDQIGVAAAFAAGGCWAGFILIGGRLARAWPDGRGLTVTMSVAALVVVPASVLAGGLGQLAEPGILLAGFAIALFSSTIPYTLELAAMRHLPSSTYGVLMSIEPAVAAVVGFLLLGQVLRPIDLAGIGLVAVASAGSSLSARRLTVAPGELEAA